MGNRGKTPENQDNYKNMVEKFDKRPAPPTGMKSTARKLWKQIVKSLAPDHFRPGDLPLLRAYCEAEDLHLEATRKLQEEGAVVRRTKTETNADGTVTVVVLAIKTNPYVAIQTQTAHTLAQLATKLRLCPNSRKSAEAAGSEKPRYPSRRQGLMWGERDDGE